MSIYSTPACAATRSTRAFWISRIFAAAMSGVCARGSRCSLQSMFLAWNDASISRSSALHRVASRDVSRRSGCIGRGAQPPPIVVVHLLRAAGDAASAAFYASSTFVFLYTRARAPLDAGDIGRMSLPGCSLAKSPKALTESSRSNGRVLKSITSRSRSRRCQAMTVVQAMQPIMKKQLGTMMELGLHGILRCFPSQRATTAFG